MKPEPELTAPMSETEPVEPSPVVDPYSPPAGGFRTTIPLPTARRRSDRKKLREGYLYEHLWNAFRELFFEGDDAWPSSDTDPDIIFHAKLYVFATQYLISSLQSQCLKSLHRDLCKFPLNVGNMAVIFDLLQFVYTNTAREEPGGLSALRELVSHYAACESSTLAEQDTFQELLICCGEMGKDIILHLVNCTAFRSNP